MLVSQIILSMQKESQNYQEKGQKLGIYLSGPKVSIGTLGATLFGPTVTNWEAFKPRTRTGPAHIEAHSVGLTGIVPSPLIEPFRPHDSTAVGGARTGAAAADRKLRKLEPWWYGSVWRGSGAGTGPSTG
jgi:hypothetical protein